MPPASRYMFTARPGTARPPNLNLGEFQAPDIALPELRALAGVPKPTRATPNCPTIMPASPARFERATSALGKRCSIQLSYGDSRSGRLARPGWFALPQNALALAVKVVRALRDNGVAV